MSHPETQESGPDLLLSIEATEMRLNPDYVKFYLIYTNFLILSLIPFILLIIMNIFIYRTVSLILKITLNLNVNFIYTTSNTRSN